MTVLMTHTSNGSAAIAAFGNLNWHVIDVSFGATSTQTQTLSHTTHGTRHIQRPPVGSGQWTLMFTW